MRNMYVDDFLHRLDTIQELCKYRENKQLFADSGFKLTKKLTNAPEVYSNILESRRAPSTSLIKVHVSSSMTQGTMSLWWNPLKDYLSFDDKTEKPVVSTQRGMLNAFHSYFDPLGLTASLFAAGQITLPTMLSYLPQPGIGQYSTY